MIKTEILKNCLQIVGQRKANAERDANINLNKALLNNDFKNLYDRQKKINFEIGKLVYLIETTQLNDSSNNEKLQNLKQEHNNNKLELNKILDSIGMKKSDITVNYFCKDCKDTGYVSKNIICGCVKDLMNIEYLKFSNLDLQKLPDFENSNTSIYGAIQPDMEKLYLAMNTYSKNLSANTKKIVLLSGMTGSGKTYLSKMMLNNVIKQNNFGIFQTSMNLVQVMLEYHLANLNIKNQIMAPYLNCDFLVIDDLGVENILKNITIEYLYMIISERLQKGLTTVITTNYTLNQIQDVYGDRIFSRLMNKRESIVFNIVSKDLRLQDK